MLAIRVLDVTEKGPTLTSQTFDCLQLGTKAQIAPFSFLTIVLMYTNCITLSMSIP